MEAGTDRAPHRLSAARIIDLADAAEGLGPSGRGRMLLQAARPAWDHATLDAVTLGVREACALELRCETFGTTFAARTTCPECGQALAVDIGAERLRRTVAPEHPPRAGETALVELDGYRVRARPIDGAAISRAASCTNVEQAAQSLLESSVVSAAHGGRPIASTELPAHVVQAVGEAVADIDPQAEVRVSLTCAICGHEWHAGFDACQFLWTELEVTAVRLLDDVHALATAYCWSEAQILELPSRRRRKYVERLTDA